MTLRRMGSLVRKTIIVMLTLAAVGTGYLWVESYVRTHRGPKYVYIAQGPMSGIIPPGKVERGRRATLWRNAPDEPLNKAWLTIRPGEAEVCAVNKGDAAVPPPAPMEAWIGDGTQSFDSTGAELGGFSYRRDVWTDTPYKGNVWAVITVPMWAPFLLFATYPTIAFMRGPLRRYRRRKRGLCLRCGYDLRGTTGGVCSECGEGVGER